MHVFHIKMYISAVFHLNAMNFTLKSPTVTWYMCAKFAAFPLSAPKKLMCGGLVNLLSLTLSKWSDSKGCDLKVFYDEKWCMYNKFHSY